MTCVEVGQDGILVVENFTIRKEIYVPRGDVAYIYVLNPES